VEVVGLDELNDPELISEEARRKRREAIDHALASWALGRTADAAMTHLQAHGVPAGKVQNARHLAEEDAQHAARGYWRKVNHDFFGERVADSFPALWDGERPVSKHLSAAFVGQDNFELWPELADLDPEEIANGMSDGLFC
jgi:crotonobetainyl-CoA:carnitine CoA-transferase CaiB-like acyl-CoA transferase